MIMKVDEGDNDVVDDTVDADADSDDSDDSDDDNDGRYGGYNDDDDKAADAEDVEDYNDEAGGDGDVRGGIEEDVGDDKMMAVKLLVMKRKW